jgi:hypothetical protein
MAFTSNRFGVGAALGATWMVAPPEPAEPLTRDEVLNLLAALTIVTDVTPEELGLAIRALREGPDEGPTRADVRGLERLSGPSAISARAAHKDRPRLSVPEYPPLAHSRAHKQGAAMATKDMDEGLSAVLDVLFDEKPSVREATLKSLSPDVQKLLLDDLASENVDADSIDSSTLRVLTAGNGKEQTIVAAFSGDPAGHFEAKYVVAGGKIRSKWFVAAD